MGCCIDQIAITWKPSNVIATLSDTTKTTCRSLETCLSFRYPLPLSLPEDEYMKNRTISLLLFIYSPYWIFFDVNNPEIEENFLRLFIYIYKSKSEIWRPLPDFGTETHQSFTFIYLCLQGPNERSGGLLRDAPLNFDTERQNLLRLLIYIYKVQMRDLEGYCETRRQILTLKPAQRAGWLAFGMAAHLLGSHKKALGILESYEHTLNEEAKTGFDFSETLLYKNMLIEEGGELEKAIAHLDEIEKNVVDKQV